MGGLNDEGQGISRRDLIAKSVAAGGLVWAAPVLMSGVAGAQTVPCCNVGTPVTLKVPQTGTNCGVQCISRRGQHNFDCPGDLVNCLGELELVVGHYQGGQDDSAIVTLVPGIQLISIAVHTGENRCYFADCGAFATGPTTGPPNTCLRLVGQQEVPCLFIGDEVPLPPAPGGRNRIWVDFDVDEPNTTVFVDTNADGQLSPVELSICISPEITALCA